MMNMDGRVGVNILFLEHNSAAIKNDLVVHGSIKEQVNTKCCLFIYCDPFDKKGGNSWSHAAVGKPGPGWSKLTTSLVNV